MPQSLALEFKYQEVVFHMNRSYGKSMFQFIQFAIIFTIFKNLHIPNSGLFNIAVNLQHEGHGSSKHKAGIQTKGSAGSYCTENTEIMLHTIRKLMC